MESNVLMGRGCVNVSGDAGHAYGKSCGVQKLMQQSGQDWHLGDEVTGSGNDPDRIDSLSGIALHTALAQTFSLSEATALTKEINDAETA
jgi:hypothetical protein